MILQKKIFARILFLVVKMVGSRASFWQAGWYLCPPSTLIFDALIFDLVVLHLRSYSIFVASIAETSLTFPYLKVVIDLGRVQRPRQLNYSDGSMLPAPLMETVDASISTLNQRLGRVGRTCDGHYVALYPRASLSKRSEHIVAGLELNPPESLKFSLSKQLRCKSNIDLHFPSGSMTITPLDDAYFRFPELGSKAMADAFFASLSLNCSEDLLLLAAVQMKFPPKSIMVRVYDQ
jgi:hypothetical protein